MESVSLEQIIKLNLEYIYRNVPNKKEAKLFFERKYCYLREILGFNHIEAMHKSYQKLRIAYGK